MAAKVNYLNNKDLLVEIQKSKASYSYFLDSEYKFYDAVVKDREDITPELIQEVKEKKAAKLMAEERQRQKDAGLKNHQIKVEEVTADDINVSDIVWRVMTYEHIPLEPERTKKPKNEADLHTKLVFPPFKHFILKEEGLTEVGRSHWEGGMENGYFCQDQGRMTNRLGRMLMTLVDRYGQRANWRGYTYLDEMKSRALLQLSAAGLQFDESRSDVPNPFAYYTVMIQNAFTCMLNSEKKNQNIRDDILIMNGVSPSMTRQIDNELEQRLAEYNEDHNIKPSEIIAIKRGAFGRPAKKVKEEKPKAKVKKTVFTESDLWEASNRQITRPGSPSKE